MLPRNVERATSAIDEKRLPESRRIEELSEWRKKRKVTEEQSLTGGKEGSMGDEMLGIDICDRQVYECWNTAYSRVWRCHVCFSELLIILIRLGSGAKRNNRNVKKTGLRLRLV